MRSDTPGTLLPLVPQEKGDHVFMRRASSCHSPLSTLQTQAPCLRPSKAKSPMLASSQYSANMLVMRILKAPNWARAEIFRHMWYSQAALQRNSETSPDRWRRTERGANEARHRRRGSGTTGTAELEFIGGVEKPKTQRSYLQCYGQQTVLNRGCKKLHTLPVNQMVVYAEKNKIAL